MHNNPGANQRVSSLSLPAKNLGPCRIYCPTTNHVDAHGGNYDEVANHGNGTGHTSPRDQCGHGWRSRDGREVARFGPLHVGPLDGCRCYGVDGRVIWGGWLNLSLFVSP